MHIVYKVMIEYNVQVCTGISFKVAGIIVNLKLNTSSDSKNENL